MTKALDFKIAFLSIKWIGSKVHWAVCFYQLSGAIGNITCNEQNENIDDDAKKLF